MRLFVGDDWAGDHHDVEVMNEAGRVLARKRLPEGVTGMARLHELIGEHLGEDAGVPPGTVRGWLRRLRWRAEEMRCRAMHQLGRIGGTDPALPEPAGSPLGDALNAVAATASGTQAGQARDSGTPGPRRSLAAQPQRCEADRVDEVARLEPGGDAAGGGAAVLQCGLARG